MLIDRFARASQRCGLCPAPRARQTSLMFAPRCKASFSNSNQETTAPPMIPFPRPRASECRVSVSPARLRRAQDRYVLDSINIGTIRVSGNIAVADTELFGRVSQPFPAEGKIVVQQYLVREEGKWRVATGDTATITTLSQKQSGICAQVSHPATAHLCETE